MTRKRTQKFYLIPGRKLNIIKASVVRGGRRYRLLAASRLTFPTLGLRIIG